MSRLGPLAPAAAVAVAIAAGCGDPVRPAADAAGRYELRSVYGSPLPAGLGGGRTITFFVMSATLELRTDGTFTRTAAVSASSPTTETFSAPDTRLTPGRWTMSGAVVTTQDSVVGSPQISPRVRYVLNQGHTLTSQPGDDTDPRPYVYEKL